MNDFITTKEAIQQVLSKSDVVSLEEFEAAMEGEPKADLLVFPAPMDIYRHLEEANGGRAPSKLQFVKTYHQASRVRRGPFYIQARLRWIGDAYRLCQVHPELAQCRITPALDDIYILKEV